VPLLGAFATGRQETLNLHGSADQAVATTSSPFLASLDELAVTTTRARARSGPGRAV